MSFFKKGRLKMFLPKDVLFTEDCFHPMCVYVHVCIQATPRVYIKDIIIS